MRVLVVGEAERPHALAEALEAEGAEVTRPPEDGADHGGQMGELAAALIAFERLLADDAPDAVLLVSTTNLALAAVLVAAKLGIPVAALVEAPQEDRTPELNVRLIEGLADVRVTDNAAAIAASLRDLIAT